MITEDNKNQQDQNVKSEPFENIPQNVVTNAARFNKQFLDSQLGGNSENVSIGKLLTAMGEQDNTIRVLSRLLGRDYNEQHIHDMHNSIFGDIAGGPSSGREGMPTGKILAQLTTFMHEQNQQIQTLIDEIGKNIKLMDCQTQLS